MDDEETLWRLTLAPDDGGHGFVHEVTTTGLCCRPTCPSRRPLRANARSHGSSSAAEAAGSRACRRCTPDRDDASSSVMSPSVAAAVAALRPAGGPVGGRELSAAAGTSIRQLQRGFAAEVGVGPRADGEELLWTAEPHPIGTLVVVASRYGVVAARIDEPGSDGAAQLATVAAELPRATFTRDDEALAGVVAHVTRLASGLPSDVALPLDVRGTAFQASVWAALRAIPAGQTRSYTEVAASIERPSAVRAVASACAANPAALVTPCHRVIRGDGGLGGFRWGLEVKRALLDAETVTTP